MQIVPHLTIWGWIALLFGILVFIKIPIGNQIVRYALLLIILLLVLMNIKSFAVQTNVTGG